jgi:hypothetical protein
MTGAGRDLPQHKGLLLFPADHQGWMPENLSVPLRVVRGQIRVRRLFSR